jgi:acyl-CoA reductase-like NAD-dependent aldehyde dehydrogenase
MPDNYPLMVPGASSEDKPLEVYAPYDNAHIATMQTADKSVIDKALQTAYDLYRNRDAWIPIAERLKILKRTGEIMSEQSEKLALEASREGGKPLVDSRIEVARAIDGIDICIETLRTQRGEEIPMNLNAASLNRLAITRLEPIGVVVAASAFNHPLNLIVHQAAPAIATGCPVIVKPAEVTPISCYLFVKILREAGLPEEWCQVLSVSDLDVASALITDERVGFFTFIGSGRVGWMLRSKLAPGTRYALEHGGAAPVIMAADANLDEAIAPLSKGGFYHAGQVCVSVQRVFAHESIAQEVADRLAESADKQKIGDPTQPDTDVGPLIRHGEVQRVKEWVEEAVSGGAKLVTGGKQISDSCFECTVLFDPPADARVSNSEIFGPVICVYPYSDIDEAIARANSLPFSFQAAVWTRDIDTALRVTRRIDAATVMINDHTAFRVDWMPFAGLKHSGEGTGGIPYTMKDMLVEKLIVVKSNEL